MDIKGWSDFIEDMQERILPLYAENEDWFDHWGIHGRLHACRAVMFAEVMARQYAACGQNVDFFAIRYATAFHDSGRRANGKDFWESDSAMRCSSYVRFLKGNAQYAKWVGELIEKNGEWGLEKHVMHDADVLEIMRPSCGHGGITGFRRDILYFGSGKDALSPILPDANALREQLINEAWNWIIHTEENSPHFLLSSEYFWSVLDALSQKKNDFPLLSSLIVS